VTTKAVVITGGHPFEAAPFVAMLDSLGAVEYRLATQPDAQSLLHPRQVRDADVLVFYDMPGIVFSRDAAPRFPMPNEKMVFGFRRLLAEGKPMLFLHHALASWPAWHEYSAVIGGKFLYSADWVNGRRYPDSGYRHGVTHTVTPVDPTHPVVGGLTDGFTITDEVYLCPVFEDSVTPLLRSDASFTDDQFYSAARAVAGFRNDSTGWRHPPGSNLIGWTKRYSNSPIVYLQPGDGPSVYGHPAYRRLLANAIAWLASDAAHDWPPPPDDILP
jgi:type 1 glutamine amidotransferase